MNAGMPKDARAYGTTVLVVWVCLTAIGIAYSTQQDIPAGIAGWFVAAALIEAALYLMPGFGSTRLLIDGIEPPAFRALVLSASAVAPYLIYALGTHTFHLREFGLLAILTSVAVSWFVLQNRSSLWIDLLFLVFMGAVFMSKVFAEIYITLAPRAKADVLGT